VIASPIVQEAYLGVAPASETVRAEPIEGLRQAQPERRNAGS
jgi:hypothetical protein